MFRNENITKFMGLRRVCLTEVHISTAIKAVSAVFISSLICQFSFANQTPAPTIPMEVQDAYWTFQPANSQKTYPVRAGGVLVRQIKDNLNCCNGRYHADIDISFVKNYGQDIQNNLGILFPPTGGLRSIQIDGNTTQFSEADFSSIGPIMEIPIDSINTGILHVDVNIQSNLNEFSGMWKTPPIIDVIPKLNSSRDASYIFQKILPIFFSAVFFVFILVLIWIQRKSKTINPIYREYLFGFFVWSVFFLFLSGTMRAFFPYFGSVMHYPFLTLAGITTFRIINICTNVSQKTTNRASIIFIFLFFVQTIGEIRGSFGQIEASLFISVVNLSAFYSLCTFTKHKKNQTDYIFLIFAFIHTIADIIDDIHLYFSGVLKSFPIVFLNRLTTPPFLFMALLYLANHLLNEIARSQKTKAFEEMSAQISHDIRSPLAALEMLSGSIAELPTEKRLVLKNSINRIRDISNSLLNRSKVSLTKLQESAHEQIDFVENFEISLLSPLIDSIVTEKRIQYRNHIDIRIEFEQTKDSYGLFSRIQPNEFKRVLSNLIDNAVEALPEHHGAVEITLKSNSIHQDKVELLVKDNGKGIPSTILPKLGIRGETYGKESGHGLGLSHAKEMIKANKGTIDLISEVDRGTTIIIKLPREPSPNWFVSEISLKKDQTVVVYDDDQSIHQIWKGRIEALPNHNSNNIRHFSDSNELRNFYGKNFSELDALFLMDYELSGMTETGLDIIENLGIQKNSILVTSWSEDTGVRERCKKLGVKLIPKSMSGFVPITITEDES